MKCCKEQVNYPTAYSCSLGYLCVLFYRVTNTAKMQQVHLEGWNQMKITLIKLNKTNDKKKDPIHVHGVAVLTLYPLWVLP